MNSGDLDAPDCRLRPLAYPDQFQMAPLPFRLLPPLRIKVTCLTEQPVQPVQPLP